MPLDTVTEEDHSHDNHDTYLIETIWDNPVEHTEWRHCNDCAITYRACNVTIIGEP